MRLTNWFKDNLEKLVELSPIPVGVGTGATAFQLTKGVCEKTAAKYSEADLLVWDSALLSDPTYLGLPIALLIGIAGAAITHKLVQWYAKPLSKSEEVE